MNIGIIGAGRFGLTLAEMIFHTDNHVTVFCLPGELHPKFIPHTCFDFNPRIEMQTEIDGLSDCEVVFIAVDGKHLASCWDQWGSTINGIAAICVKTIDAKDGKLILPTDLFPHKKSVFCASAAFPEGLLRRSPTSGTIFGPKKYSEIVRGALPKRILRTYHSDDIIGAQLGSALKNVIAIASGVAYGLGFDIMTRATICNRGSFEIMRFAVANGALMKTFCPGSSILADLTGTCFSDDSHNLMAGKAIALGTSISLLTPVIGTIEGIQTTRVLTELPGALCDMPISNAVADILFHGVSPEQAIDILLNRPLIS